MINRNTVLSAIFLLILSLNILLIVAGVPQQMMVESEMAFWLSILWPVQAISISFTIIYSLVRYARLHEYRDLLLLFLSANLLLVGFFYMLTNESSVVLSPFADRDRNRTIVTALGLILGPSILLSSITGTTEEHRRRSMASVLWGGFVVPFIVLSFFLSPEPVFITKPVGEGFLALSLWSWILLLFTFASLIFSFSKVFTAWREEHNTIDLALTYAIILWSCAIVAFMIQSHPLQVMELIWFSFFMAGTLVIAIAGVMSAIIDPQRELTTLVDIRSKQLLAAKQETEYFLNLWGHKIGNLLQAITIYLEMRALEEKTDSTHALELTRKTTLINRQVGTLIKIKETVEHELFLVSIVPIIEKTLSSTEEMIGSVCRYKISSPANASVLADDMLEFVFLNVCSYICKGKDEIDIQLTVKVQSDTVIVNITYPGRSLPLVVVESLMSEIVPTRTTLSLDMFIVKILMERYNGRVAYEYNDSTQSNRFALEFRTAIEA